MLIKTVLKQNYLSFQGNIYQPTKGVFMGIIAEIFLQHIENTQLKQIIDTNNMIFYTRYVDELLIIYYTRKIFPAIIIAFLMWSRIIILDHIKKTPLPEIHTHTRTQNFQLSQPEDYQTPLQNRDRHIPQAINN
jgi:hypothetical protein